MVREEAYYGRGTAVWKECVTNKAVPTSEKVETNAPVPATVATAGRSGQSSSRRRRTNTATPDADASGAVAAVGAAAPGGGTAAAGGSNTGGSKGTTANVWLEAPPSSTTLAAPPPPSSPAPPAVGRPLAAAALSASAMVPATTNAYVQESAHSGEVFLMEMLASMDQHMQQLRETQQGLVATVEMACRRALGRNFVRLVLVGSVALRVETPGSDVDVVCFTRRDGAEAAADGHYEACGLPVDVLRRVHWALTDLVGQYADHGANFSMNFIDDARVPILRVLWGSSIAVDVSVDQSRPVDHVRWFQRVGAAPRPTAPPPAVAPLVTLTLRCVKWWLRQRQVPRTKEGGMATIAWLLMAVHVCSLPETHEQAIISGQRPMVALLASLAAFFHHYAAMAGLDCVLVFAPDGSSSEFRQDRNKNAPPRQDKSRGPYVANSPWGELSVLDPTREGIESLDLAPRLPPATQLLLSHELRRASERLRRVPKGRELSYGDGRRVLEEVFEPLAEGVNNLPSFAVPSMGLMGVLLLWDREYKGVGNVELGIIDSISPRPGWAAPFLHRADDRSELYARLLDVEECTGRANLKNTHHPEVVLCPCHFICRVNVEKDGRSWRLDNEGLERLVAMRRYLSERTAYHESQEILKASATKVEDLSTSASSEASAENLAKLPSPSRATDVRTSRTP